MREFTRVAIASRSFALAAILGLSIAFDDPGAAQATMVVVVTAAIAAYLSVASVVPSHWILAIEAGLASLVVVLTLPESILILPYLVVLPLLAGLARGLFGSALVTAFELGAILSLGLTSDGLSGLTQQKELLAPWSLTIAGAALLGASIRRLGKAPGGEDDESYESARRLLLQLRALGPRLTSGLDPIAIAGQMLALMGEAADGRAGVFTKTQGGVLVPLAYQGPAARESLDANDPFIERCWSTEEGINWSIDAPDGAPVFVRAYPLRVGSGMVGVLLCHSPAKTPDRVAQQVQGGLDQLTLRLDTALAFDEVRTLVTTEERQRLAREIHDGIAQEVASLGYVVDEISSMTNDADVVEPLKQLRSELSRVVTELRLSIFDLRAEVGTGAGLGSALSDYVRKVGAQSSLTVHLTLDEAPTRLTPAIETELFRIAQEAITNARKHSDAENLWVDCRVYPPHAFIQVRDDGRGVGSSRADSYGLRIMQERAERIEGQLTVQNGSRKSERPGTCVTISLGERFIQERTRTPL
jgi:signal transduction histidine kinase